MLSECLSPTEPSSPPSNCDSSTLASEIADIQAFHKYLAGSPGQTPFATLVILHNLVTASVASHFIGPARRQYLCVQQAYQQLYGNVGDVGFLPAVPILPAGISLPGVGMHALVTCA